MEIDTVAEEAEVQHDKACVYGADCYMRYEHIDRTFLPQVTRNAFVDARKELYVVKQQLMRREAELMSYLGPCRDRECDLHYGHKEMCRKG